MLAAHEFFDALPTHIFEVREMYAFTVIAARAHVSFTIRTSAENHAGIPRSHGGYQARRPIWNVSFRRNLQAKDRVPRYCTNIIWWFHPRSTVLKPSDITAPSSSPAPAKAPEFRYVLSPSPTPWSTLLAANNPRFQSLQPGQRVEISPESWAAARRVGELVAGREAARPKGLGIDRSEEEEQRRETERKAQPGAGGAAIVVDYGDEKAFGGSFRVCGTHLEILPTL